MDNSMYFDTRAMMMFCFMTMLSLTIIISGYYLFGKKYNNIKPMILGNIAYTLFFLVVIIDTRIQMWKFPVLVAFLDLSATILWVMGLNSTIGLKQPRKQYIIYSFINIFLTTIMYYFMNLRSLTRASTTILITLILIQTTYKMFKNREVKELDSFRFTSFSMILFSAFKMGMSFYRMFSRIAENSMINKDISINIFTFISLIFAIWINFSVSYLNHDILRNEVEELSLKDHLTKLPNRRMIMKKFEEFLLLQKRSKLKFAITIFDLDDFKKVNDNYGHNIGDEVLKGFALVLNESIRKIDIAGRYGGEEFLVILQVNNIQEAEIILERIRLDLSNKRFSNQKISVSVSGGFVMVDDSMKNLDIRDIIAIADNRMYIAKSSGKNKIVYE